MNNHELESLLNRIQILRDDLYNCLLQYISVENNSIISDAYRSFLAEKMKKSPEQAISELFDDLQFLASSISVYNDLESFYHLQSSILSSLNENSSSNALVEIDTAQPDLVNRLSQHGISESWLLRHELFPHNQETANPGACPASKILYKKVKGGIRIDAVKESDIVIIPDFIDGLPVIRIGANAFSKRKDIETVVLPKCLLEIEENAFSYSSITSIAIPGGVEKIGEFAFYCCKKLEYITLPQNLKHIRNSAFRKCVSLATVEIPPKTTYIGDAVFYECTKLASIRIPNSVSRMGGNVVPNRVTIYCDAGSRASRYVEEHYTLKQKAYESYPQNT